MKTYITFMWEGLTFHASGYFEPGDPGFIDGPPEDCWPPAPAMFEFDTLEVEDGATWLDARWLLQTSLIDDVERCAIATANVQELTEDWRIGRE